MAGDKSMQGTEGIKVIYLPIDSLTPYEKNARRHTDDDVQYIENSIKEFGFNDPVGIWSEKNLVVEGHGRILAAKNLGMTEIPCIRLDHLTDEQRKAYALAHNKTAELSAWDFSTLSEELEAISLSDIDMEKFGFLDAVNDIDIDSLFEPVDGFEEKEPKRIQCPHCGEWFEP